MEFKRDIKSLPIADRQRRRSVSQIIRLFEYQHKCLDRRKFLYKKQINYCYRFQNRYDPFIRALGHEWMTAHRDYLLNKRITLLSLFLTVAQRMGAKKISFDNHNVVVFGDPEPSTPLSFALANTFFQRSAYNGDDWVIGQDITFCQIKPIDWLIQPYFATYDLTDPDEFVWLRSAVTKDEIKERRIEIT